MYLAIGLVIYWLTIAITGVRNKSLWIDEGYSNLTSLVISQKGLPVYDSGFVDTSYMILHFLQGAIFKLFGYTDLISRFLPIFFGLLSVMMVYIIAKQVYNKKVANLASLFTMFGYYYVVASTQSRYYSLLTLMYLIGIFLINRFVDKKTLLSFFVALNFAFFGIIFHVYLYSLLVILAVAFLYYIYFTKSYKDKKLIYKLVAIIINFILFWLITKAINPGVTAQAVSDALNYVRFDYIVNYIRFWFDNYGLLFVMCYAAIVMLFVRPDIKKTLIVLAFFFPFMVISKSVFLFANRYMYFLIPLVVILGIGTLDEIIGYIKDTKLRSSAQLIGLFMILFSTTIYVSPYQKLSNNDVFSPEPDFKSAYNYISQDTGDYNIISVFPHMDKLYLGKSDGYIYIDETGMGVSPVNNFYIRENKNVFTNAQVILSTGDLNKFEDKTTYIVLDRVGMTRLVNSDLIKYIQSNYTRVYQKIDGNDFVYIYRHEVSL